METTLCKLAFHYGSDKCPQILHSYTPFYYEFLKDKDIKKVLEMGIGDLPYRARIKKQGFNPQLGASLKMWRDFFPQAKVYGADIDPDTMFTDERIETFICDQTKKRDLRKLIEKTGSDIDLFIDDGLHAKETQIFMAQVLMPLLKKEVIYVIEDIGFPKHVMAGLSKYNCERISLPEISDGGRHKNRMIIVTNK
jgi:hypothetical protein